jgi:hypothetical protein
MTPVYNAERAENAEIAARNVRKGVVIQRGQFLADHAGSIISINSARSVLRIIA